MKSDDIIMVIQVSFFLFALAAFAWHLMPVINIRGGTAPKVIEEADLYTKIENGKYYHVSWLYFDFLLRYTEMQRQIIASNYPKYVDKFNRVPTTIEYGLNSNYTALNPCFVEWLEEYSQTKHQLLNDNEVPTEIKEIINVDLNLSKLIQAVTMAGCHFLVYEWKPKQ
ncbi:MAG: hypothetical protein Q4P13_10695 [Psychrobacter sp.]|nr:hypothetical protein [Psychrobacter sp.]